MKPIHSLALWRRGAEALAALSVALVLPSASPKAATTNDLDKINHIIVVFQENWSFDSLYPDFPGADGLANAASTRLYGQYATSWQRRRPSIA